MIYFSQGGDGGLRAELGIPADTNILVYNGNVHPANVNEVRSLYLAIGALARGGTEIVLVRLGTDNAPVLTPELSDIARLIVKVPFQPRERLPTTSHWPTSWCSPVASTISIRIGFRPNYPSSSLWGDP